MTVGATRRLSFAVSSGSEMREPGWSGGGHHAYEKLEFFPRRLNQLFSRIHAPVVAILKRFPEPKNERNRNMIC